MTLGIPAGSLIQGSDAAEAVAADDLVVEADFAVEVAVEGLAVVAEVWV